MLSLSPIQRASLAAFAAALGVWARSVPGNPAGAANVNSRYTVERVDVAPMGLDKISAPLRDRLQQLVGVRFDASLLDEAAARLKRELRNREVTTQVARGSSPDKVSITFQVELQNRTFEAQLTEFLYHSKEQLGFGVDLVYRTGGTRVHAGALSDNDDLVERFSGVRGGYERSLARGFLRVGIDAAAWRSQWNASTLAAAAGDTYRQRQTLLPSATIQFSKPLTLQLGVSVERLEVNNPAARHELSSAAFGTLRFQRRWGLDSGLRQRFEAAYGIRTGMPSLASDFSFTRHHWMARYGLRHNNEEILASFQAGLMSGRAPFSERFIGGNSRILRGWNRFDLTPAGADRLANVSFDYRWRKLRLSYDAGSVRALGAGLPDPSLRHSAGIGISNNLWSGLSFLVAFPLREGRVEPIFIAGMNF